MDDEQTGETSNGVRQYTYERGYNRARSVWNEARIELLKSLWNDGLSASQIARRIGGFEHCSDGGRSAVIGKVHRLNLSARSAAAGRTPARRKRNASKATYAWRLEQAVFGGDRSTLDFPKGRPPDPLPLPSPGEADKARVSFLDLEARHCRYIPGDPVGPFVKQFCGLPTVPGLSWCLEHAHRCGAAGRTPEHYRPPNTGRILLNAAGSLRGEMEDA